MAASPRAQNLSLINRWRAWIMKSWFARLEYGQLTVNFPSGQQQTFTGVQKGTQAHLTIHDLRLVNRLIASGDLGLAESYMAKEWSTSDLSSLLRLGLANWKALEGTLDKSLPFVILDRLKHSLRANTKRGSRRNIAAHYDLGNNFYRKWLDPSMTYSSALFETMNEPLEVAQRRKYLRLAKQLNLQPNDRVLEIGCGWGGFAEIAASEFGCHVVALTLSERQAAYTRKRLSEANLNERVEVRLQDYRDIQGQFNKIVSIEMFEAVGEKYWPVYLRTLRDRLAPLGQAALQIITMADELFSAYRHNPEFIQRYIFPGGMLPGQSAFREAVENAGLQITEHFSFSASYAETLRRWDSAFRTAWPEIKTMGFDDRFFRMWRYYLCYCEVGFEIEQINVGHFTLANK